MELNYAICISLNYAICICSLVNCFGIELCNLYLTRCDLTKDLLFDTFFIAAFTNNVAVIMEYFNSNVCTEDVTKLRPANETFPHGFETKKGENSVALLSHGRWRISQILGPLYSRNLFITQSPRQ